MKITKICLFVLTILISFYLGTRYAEIFDRTIENGSIVIEQVDHDWNMDRDRKAKPVILKLFARNTQDKPIKGKVKFKISLDTSGVDQQYMNRLIELVSAENILNYDKPSARLSAIKKYIGRDKKLLPRMRYELIENNDEASYVTYITKKLAFQPGETLMVDAEVMLPPKKRGYIITVEQ